MGPQTVPYPCHDHCSIRQELESEGPAVAKAAQRGPLYQVPGSGPALLGASSPVPMLDLHLCAQSETGSSSASPQAPQVFPSKAAPDVTVGECSQPPLLVDHQGDLSCATVNDPHSLRTVLLGQLKSLKINHRRITCYSVTIGRTSSYQASSSDVEKYNSWEVAQGISFKVIWAKSRDTKARSATNILNC